jgi:hypothetical protein
MDLGQQPESFTNVNATPADCEERKAQFYRFLNEHLVYEQPDVENSSQASAASGKIFENGLNFSDHLRPRCVAWGGAAPFNAQGSLWGLVVYQAHFCWAYFNEFSHQLKNLRDLQVASPHSQGAFISINSLLWKSVISKLCMWILSTLLITTR